MTNPFRDQEKFMKACDQKVDAYSISQYKMYLNLIAEEYQELKEAVDAGVEIITLVINWKSNGEAYFVRDDLPITPFL